MLPSHLHDAMGSANLLLARGDSEAAVQLCNEVIRQGNLVLHWVLDVFITEMDLFRSPSRCGAIPDAGNVV